MPARTGGAPDPIDAQDVVRAALLIKLADRRSVERVQGGCDPAAPPPFVYPLVSGVIAAATASRAPGTRE